MLNLRRMARFFEPARSIGQVCKGPTRIVALASLILLAAYSSFQIIFKPVEMNICPNPSLTKNFYLPTEDDNITIVTMYVNLGSHKRSKFFWSSPYSYHTDQYRSWLLSWGKLQNPVIAFFDDEEFIKRFKFIRSHLPESFTRIVKITKEDLPAFHQKGRIEEILANPSFKTSYPAEYTCAMNAKYDAMEMALKMGDIRTKYIAWMDIGLWRKLQEEDPSFTMNIPPDFNSSKIGFTEVTPRETLSHLSPIEIYQQNVVWVAGGFVLGTKEILTKFITSYRKTTDDLLTQGLADTDQQVIASMYSPPLAWKQDVEILTYACPRGAFGLFGHSYLYFCLPYICRASAECKSKIPVMNNYLLSQSIGGVH